VAALYLLEYDSDDYPDVESDYDSDSDEYSSASDSSCDCESDSDFESETETDLDCTSQSSSYSKSDYDTDWNMHWEDAIPESMLETSNPKGVFKERCSRAWISWVVHEIHHSIAMA